MEHTPDVNGCYPNGWMQEHYGQRKPQQTGIPISTGNRDSFPTHGVIGTAAMMLARHKCKAGCHKNCKLIAQGATELCKRG